MEFLQNAVIAVLIFLNTFVSGTLGFFHLASSTPIDAAVQNMQPSFAPQTPITTSVNNTNSARVTTSISSPSLSTTTLVRNPHNLYNLPTSAPDYGCYQQQGDAVVVDMQEAATPETKLLPDTDVQTFQDLSIFNLCFGKDKNHVYFYDQTLQWADPATFTVLAYFRGSPPTLFLQNGGEILSWRDYGNFSPTVSSDCTPGPSDGFCVVPGGDAKTFQVIEGAYDIPPWAKDKHNVYCAGAIIPGADPSTAQLIDRNTYMRVTVGGRALTYFGCAVVSATST